MAIWAFTWPITIDATNNKIDIDEDNGSGGVGIVVATLTSGTYRDTISDSSVAGSLAKEIKTALEVVGNGTYTVTVSDDGKYTIAGTIVFDIGWLNGANAATSPRYVLGWTNEDAVPQALSHTAPYQHRHGLYSSTAGPDIETDTKFWRAKRHAELNQSNSGAMARLPFGSEREFLDIKIGAIGETKIQPATTSYDAYKSLRDLWDYLTGGDHRYFRWHQDTGDEATYTDVWWDPQQSDWEYNPERYGPGILMWRHEMRIWKHV